MKENLHSLKNNMSTLAQILIDACYAAGEIFRLQYKYVRNNTRRTVLRKHNGYRDKQLALPMAEEIARR